MADKLRWIDVEYNPKYYESPPSRQIEIRRDFFNSFLASDPQYKSLAKKDKQIIERQFVYQGAPTLSQGQDPKIPSLVQEPSAEPRPIPVLQAGHGNPRVEMPRFADDPLVEPTPEFSLGRTVGAMAEEAKRGVRSSMLGRAAYMENTPAHQMSLPGNAQLALQPEEMNIAAEEAYKDVKAPAAELMKQTAEKIPVNPEYNQSSGFREDVARGVAGFAAPMLMAPSSPGASIEQSYHQLTGQKYEELIKQGVPKERAYETSAALGVVNTALESAGNVVGLGEIGKIVGPMLMKTVGKRASVFFPALFKTMTAEGVEEYSQGVAEEVANMYAFNPDTPPDILAAETVKRLTSKDTQSSLGYQALVGAGGGAMMVGGAKAVQTGAQAAQYLTEYQKQVNGNRAAKNDSGEEQQGDPVEPGINPATGQKMPKGMSRDFDWQQFKEKEEERVQFGFTGAEEAGPAEPATEKQDVPPVKPGVNPATGQPAPRPKMETPPPVMPPVAPVGPREQVQEQVAPVMSQAPAGVTVRDTKTGDTEVITPQDLATPGFQQAIESGRISVQETPEAAAERNGVMFNGMQEFPPEMKRESMFTWTDPETKSTFLTKTVDEVPGALKAKRAEFGKPAAAKPAQSDFRYMHGMSPEQVRVEEQERATEAITRQLFAANKESKSAIAQKMTEQQAQYALDRLGMAPGDDPAARAAVYEKFPGLRPETKLGVETDISITPEKVQRRGIDVDTSRNTEYVAELSGIAMNALKASGLTERLNDITVELKPVIDLRGKNTAQTQEDWKSKKRDISVILGATTLDNLKATVEISLEQNKGKFEHTSFHEALHVAAKWVLPEAKYDFLMNSYKRNEESVADAYADFMMKRKKPVGPVLKIFQQLAKFFREIGNFLRGRGFTSAEQIFGDLAAGKYSGNESAAEGGQTQVAFQNETRAPIWYSQMQQFLEKKLPGKGSPQQLKQMLKTWADKGEYKSEELEWSGVLEWLDTKGDKVSKQEVIDYLAENNLRVEEVVKGAGTINKDAGEEIKQAEKALSEAQKRQERVIANAKEILRISDIYKNIENRDQKISDLVDAMGSRYNEDEDVTGKVFGLVAKYDPEGQINKLEGELSRLHKEKYGEFNPLALLTGKQPDTAEMAAIRKKIDVLGNYRGFDWDHVIDAEYDVRNAQTELSDAKINAQEVETKYFQYQLPGGENYRELLITIPEKFRNQTKDEIAQYLYGQNYNELLMNHKDAIDAAYGSSKKSDSYRSPHWDEPNVLVHVRFHEQIVAGKRTIIIDEIQGDWQSDIRKKGANTKAKFPNNLTVMRRNGRFEVVDADGQGYELQRGGWAIGSTEQEARDKVISDLQTNFSVPDAPWKKSYYLKAMQRMVRYAAEKGFDGIAWTPGSVHFERWGSEKIAWERDADGWMVDVKSQVFGNAGGVDIEAEADARGMNPQDGEKITSREELRDLIDFIAKENRSQYSPQNYEAMLDARTDKVWKRMQEEDVGVSLPRKEGFENIYDEKIPNEVSKFFGKKAWGNPKVGKIKVTTRPTPAQRDNMALTSPEFDGVEPRSVKSWTELWHLPITKEMRDRSLSEGMTLFAVDKKPVSRDEFQAKWFGNASIGEYATGAPPGQTGTEQGVSWDLPELVEFTEMLGDGSLPVVKKKLRVDEAAGVFYPTKGGRIELRADIFQDTKQAAAVFAHEIGHFIDYLGKLGNTMKRGNILGHILSLNRYLKKTLPVSPDVKPLTDADRKRLEAEARKLVRKEAERLIDEEIVQTTPITPADVLAIWNATADARKLTPELYDFIATLDAVTKKSIVKEAMKGITRDELQRFAKEVRVKTGKQIKSGAFTEADVRRKFGELWQQELEKRRDFTVGEILKELKTLSWRWRPFNEAKASPKYVSYRLRNTELYADAFSALLNNPAWAKSVAPRFFEGVFNYMDNKPEVKIAYDQVMKVARMSPEEKAQHHLGRIVDMFTESSAKRNEIAEKRRIEFRDALGMLGDQLMIGLWDKNHPALKFIRGMEKSPNQAISKQAREVRLLLEETAYISDSVSALLYDFEEKIGKRLRENGYDIHEFGAVAFAKRITEGDRKDKANPGGFTDAALEEDLKHWRKEWGDEKYNAFMDMLKDYRELREKYVFPDVFASGITTPELQKILKDVKQYFTFDVTEHMNAKYGSGANAAAFYRQLGTFKGVDNPVIATMLKDASLLRAAVLNKTKRELVKALENIGVPREVKLQGGQPIDPSKLKEYEDLDLATLRYLEDGEAKYTYLPADIVKMFETEPAKANMMARAFAYMTQPFKEIMVSKNVAWLTRNPVRDLKATIKNNPEIELRDSLKLANYYRKSWNEIKDYAFKGIRSKDVQEMLRQKMIPARRIWAAREEHFETELDRMMAAFAISPEAHDRALKERGVVKKVWERLDAAGQMSDIWGKLAGYKYLRDNTNLPPAEIAHRVRQMIGTQNFKQIGQWHTFTNNAFMFSNIAKQSMRAMFEAMRMDPVGYLWKTFVINIMPKLALIALTSGGLRDWLEAESKRQRSDGAPLWMVKKLEHMRRVAMGMSEYDRSHYTNIPLGLTEKGKSVYLAIPQDYEGQLWGAITHKILSGHIGGVGGLGTIASQAQPYHLHPLLETAHKLMTYYMLDQRPIDTYRGQHIMTEQEKEAGGKWASERMFWDLWRTVGLSALYSPDWDDLKSETPWTQVFNFAPFNVAKAWVRVTDRGITEEFERRVKILRRDKARASLAAKDGVVNLLNNKALSDIEGLALLNSPIATTRNRARSMLINKYGETWMKVYENARNEEERAAAGWMILELGLTGSDFVDKE